MKKNQLAAGAVPEPAHSPDVLEKTRNELEFARLRTERQKLALDIRLKRRELAIEPRKAWKELLGNPFTIAIMGGFITLMTQIVVNRLNVSTNSELESTKASLAADSEKLRADLADKSAYKTLQADLIKKFVESPEKETVRNNLTFLVEADLLPNYAEGIRKYLKDHPFQAPQVGSGGDGCGGVTVGTLPVVRKRFLNEVQDLNIRRLIAASTAAEVGGQGSEAEQYYIESVFNRATSRHKTLRETLMDGPPYGMPTSVSCRLCRGVLASLARFAPMNEEEVRNVKDAIVEAIKSHPDQRGALLGAIAELTPHLNEEKVRNVKDAIVEAINMSSLDRLGDLVQTVVVRAPHLKPEGVRALMGPIVQTIKGMTSPDQGGDLMQIVVSLAPHLSPDDARTLKGPAVEAINMSSPTSVGNLVQAVAALAPYLEPYEARELTGAIFQVIIRMTEGDLANVLGLSRRDLKAEEAHLLKGLIVEAIKTDPDRHGFLVPAVVELWPHLKLEQAQAREVTGTIVEAIKGARNPELRGELARAVVALEAHLNQEEANEVTGAIVEAIKGERNPELRSELVRAVLVLGPHLNPEVEREIRGAIVQALTGDRGPEPILVLARAVASLVLHLKPEELRALTGLIVEAIKREKDRDERNPRGYYTKEGEAARDMWDMLQGRRVGYPHGVVALAQALVALAPHLKSDEVRALTGPIVEAIKGVTTPEEDAYFETLRALRPGRDEDAYLAGLRGRWAPAPGDPATVAGRKAAGGFTERRTPQLKLTEVRARSGHPYRLGPLAQAFSDLASHLNPVEVRALTGPIVEEIKRTPNPERLATLAQIVLALVPHLNPKDVRALTGPIVAATKHMADYYSLDYLAPEVAALAPHLIPEEVRALTGLIIDEMQRGATFNTANTLAALAEQLPWLERLSLLVSVLKYPTIYGDSREVLVEAAKEHPEAKTIKQPRDIWAVVEWLKTQPGIDLTTPPQRMRAVIR